MRDFELEEPAALIYVPGRSLLHLRGWAEKRKVFERVARSLRPGGRFAFNAFAFSHTVAASLDGQTLDKNGVVHTLTTRSATTASTSAATAPRRSGSGGRRSPSGKA